MKIKGELNRIMLVLLLPASIAAGLLIFDSFERQRAGIELSTLETARALTQVVDMELASSRRALQALATTPYLASGDLEAFDRQARALLADMPGSNVVLIDASGQQLVNTLRPFGEALPRHSNPEQARRVFDSGQSSISDLYAGAVTHKPVIGIDVPVLRGGEVIYDLSMGMFPTRLGEVLSRQALPAGWVGGILDSQGTIVARTHEADRYIGHKAAPALVQHLASESEGRLETDTLEGIPVISVFSRSSQSNWSVAIGIPRAELKAQLRTTIAWLLAGTIVLLGVGMVLAQLFSARIGRSIRGLLAPATALSRRESISVPALEFDEADEVAQALVSASRMLRDREDILAVVSHDLRNPLSTILLTAGVAEQMAAKLPGSESVRAMLTRVTESSTRMAGMVDDLLAVAVATSGQRSMLKLAPVSAQLMLERAKVAVGPLFSRAGIELLVDSGSALPDVQIDADRILRVFVNLLDNALKFTRRPGRVVVQGHAQPGAVRFCVANSGPPLSPQMLQSMLLPFWQASEDRRGAGLGLSICRSIIETHGGRIWAEPAPGMCVRICFEVPLAVSAAQAAASETPGLQRAVGN